MQLVLVDCDFTATSTLSPCPGILEILVNNRLIFQRLLAYKQGHDLNDEDRARKKLISEIMETEDDLGSSLTVKSQAGNSYTCDSHTVEISVQPLFQDKSILKTLVEKFKKKVKLTLHLDLKWHDGRTGWAGVESVFLEGMEIDPETFTCQSIDFVDNAGPFRIFPYQSHVKLVADIDSNISNVTNLERLPLPFAQKVLEEEAFSDLIITAGNGAKIKAHKSFLSVCSDVFKAMFRCKMEESQTGHVDMSDLSEDGVKAFLRYVYHNDLGGVQENFQVAYDLLYASHKYGVSSLETEIKRILLEMKDEDFDVSVAFKTYMFTRNIKSAVELKTKVLQVLKGKWDKLELLQEYNDFFEKPSNFKIARELCRDLAKAASAGCSCSDVLF